MYLFATASLIVTAKTAHNDVISLSEAIENSLLYCSGHNYTPCAKLKK